MPDTSVVCQSLKPQESQYYQCVEDNFETLEQVYDDRFARQYGFFRPYVKQVIYRFLDCSILQNSISTPKQKYHARFTNNFDVKQSNTYGISNDTAKVIAKYINDCIEGKIEQK
jgi:hypothetical protein